MTDCNGCGGCCDPVVMPETLREVQSRLPRNAVESENRTFMLTHLTPMHRREGLNRAPYLDRSDTLLVDRFGEVSVPQFFSCDLYDPVTRRCTDHANRPPMCREFPWRGKAPTQHALPHECSFQEDQRVEFRSRVILGLAET